MTARAICEKILINTHFSKVYLRSILGKLNGINQLANFDTDLFNQLRKIKTVDNIEDVSLQIAKFNPQIALFDLQHYRPCHQKVDQSQTSRRHHRCHKPE